MKVGSELVERLTRAGYRLCNSCLETIDKIETRGIDWTENHKHQLARIVNANLRRDRGRVPLNIRTRWIERQITLAIKQAKKGHTNGIHSQ